MPEVISSLLFVLLFIIKLIDSIFSAGVGRTGTFACVYSASEEIMGGNGLGMLLPPLIF